MKYPNLAYFYFVFYIHQNSNMFLPFFYGILHYATIQKGHSWSVSSKKIWSKIYQ